LVSTAGIRRHGTKNHDTIRLSFPQGLVSMLYSLKAILGHLRALPPEEVLGKARRIFRSRSHLEIKSGDHLLLGLACLTDNLQVARTILHRRPDIINDLCVPDPVSARARTGAFFENAVFHGGMPPLHAAISLKNWKVAGFLLSCPGVKVDLLGSLEGEARWGNQAPGMTPLFQVLFLCGHTTSLTRLHPILRFGRRLMDAGANPFKADGDGISPFSFALISTGQWNEVQDRFQAAQLTLEMFLPVLPALTDKALSRTKDASTALLDMLHDIFAIEENTAGVSKSNLAWLRKKTGLDFERYDELVIGWLMDNGLNLSVVNRFASKNLPGMVAFLEKNHLQQAILEPDDGLLEPRKPLRL
jgi:hypothetical protein